MKGEAAGNRGGCPTGKEELSRGGQQMAQNCLSDGSQLWEVEGGSGGTADGDPC